MAAWGEGYTAWSLPASMVEQYFEGARAAWSEAGRAGSPRLVAIAYFAFADVEAGKANIYDYYSFLGEEMASGTASIVAAGAEGVRETVKAFEAIGADELILSPALADLSEVAELADVVL
jgi:alkanesulfonate monooxygenase SsuD/methylene tetrahydromethanopterin reductase-like flavin-dependent oxidoreductase (luciferase family)